MLGAATPIHIVLVNANIHQVFRVIVKSLLLAIAVRLEVDVASRGRRRSKVLFEVELAGELALAKVQAFNTIAIL